jgi:uncharacterized repeat protein (TIGR01451 family)
MPSGFRRFVLCAALVSLLLGSFAPSVTAAEPDQAGATSAERLSPTVGPKVKSRESEPVRDLPKATSNPGRSARDLQSTSTGLDVPNTNVKDPVGQFSDAGTLALTELGNPIVNVNGLGGANPNDTTGDVGPNHYVQAINSQVRITDKQGVLAAGGGPFNLGTFWQNNDGIVDPCEGNAGDPQVLYDNLADRWLVAQFAQTQFLCIAISQTADPTGTYHQYVFTVDRFPDYFKVGAWPDGYYVSANYNGPNAAMALVLDRANMLNGNPAGSVEFEAPSVTGNLDVLLPSDVDGQTNPAPGTPNYMYRQVDGDILGGADRLEIWEFQVNWITPALSTFALTQNIATAPFDSTTCGFGFPPTCIPQPGTAVLLDSIPYWGMARFPYRNFGDHEVMAGNFTVDANGADGVGIRWFILERSGGGAWAVANEGTYAPQPTGAPVFVHRWMGSLAMDRFENLALGHTRSSGQNISPTVTGNPSAMYTGRLADDPLGLLPQPEITIQPGAGTIGGNRWGDYYSMTVDPVDDCTFWYTGDFATAAGVRQSAIASFRFADCATDLEITKTVSPAHPVAGQEIVYTITVTNDGPIAAQNVIVEDDLPVEVNYLADTDTCSGVAVGDTGTLTCELGTIEAGASKAFEIKVSIDPDLGGATSITNTATVTSDANESDPADNTIALTHLGNELADVRVTKLCKPDTEPAPAGTNGICSIFVNNDGPSAARNVTLTDTHVSDGPFTLATSSPGCAAGATVVTCNLGTIQPGGTVQVDVTVSSSADVDVNDVAKVTSATPDPAPGNNEAVAGLSFDASADLLITKSGPATATPGDEFTYTLGVDNLGPSTAENVIVTDELPADVDFVSADADVGTFTEVDGTVTWNLGNVAVADPVLELDITVFVHPDATDPLVNSAAVTSSTSDPNTGNNLAIWTVNLEPDANLTLTKTDSPDPVTAGDDLTYTLTVGNSGPSTAVDVVVTDTIPAQTTFVSAVGGTGTTACAEIQIGVVSCEVGNLDPGETETIFITVHVAADTPDGTILHNEAEATSPTDPDGAQASADTTVVTEADLWMEKTGTAVAGNPSGALVYTLTVHNHPGSAPDDTPTSGAGGPSDAQDVVVSDPLPLTPKKLKVQFLSPGCTYSEGSHTVTCSTSTVPFGTSVVFEFQVQIQGSNGTITNTATVASSTPDPVASNNSDTTNNVVQGGTGKGKKPN